jgi:hypothetical protein
LFKLKSSEFVFVLLIEILRFREVAAELGAKAMTAEPAGLESSVEDAEHVCQEVRNLLAKAQTMLDRVRDLSAPKLMSTTLTGVLEALALREDGEDPLITAVCQQVTTGSESVFSIMMIVVVSSTDLP